VKTVECIPATQSRAYVSLLFLNILGTQHLHAHRSSKDRLLLLASMVLYTCRRTSSIPHEDRRVDQRR
jgi:hypothetical protein